MMARCSGCKYWRWVPFGDCDYEHVAGFHECTRFRDLCGWLVFDSASQAYELACRGKYKSLKIK